MSEIPAILCFEKYYSDGSGVEYSIRYDHQPYLHDKSCIGFVTLTHLDDISMPVNQLDWLIDKLSEINNHVKTNT